MMFNESMELQFYKNGDESISVVVRENGQVLIDQKNANNDQLSLTNSQATILSMFLQETIQENERIQKDLQSDKDYVKTRHTKPDDQQLLFNDLL